MIGVEDGGFMKRDILFPNDEQVFIEDVMNIGHDEFNEVIEI